MENNFGNDFDVSICSVEHTIRGFLKIPEFNYVTTRGDKEKRNLLFYEVKMFNNRPYNIVLKIPEFESFYCYLIEYSNFDNRLNLFNDSINEIAERGTDMSKLSRTDIEEYVKIIFKSLSNRIPKLDEVRVDFWYDNYKYCGYDKEKVEDRKY